MASNDWQLGVAHPNGIRPSWGACGTGSGNSPGELESKQAGRIIIHAYCGVVRCQSSSGTFKEYRIYGLNLFGSGSKPCTPGEHKNSWYMDVHPSKNGINRYWFIAIDVSKTIRIRSVQTWRIGKPNITKKPAFQERAAHGSPPFHLGQEVACIQQGLRKIMGKPSPMILGSRWKPMTRHCPTSSTSRATESSRAHALFHPCVFTYYTHMHTHTYI